jgi:hypothetical protein
MSGKAYQTRSRAALPPYSPWSVGVLAGKTQILSAAKNDQSPWVVTLIAAKSLVSVGDKTEILRAE